MGCGCKVEPLGGYVGSALDILGSDEGGNELHAKVHTIYDRNVTTVLIHWRDGLLAERLTVGSAKRAPGAKYNKATGRQIALARALRKMSDEMFDELGDV